ncbi:MAG: hydantoinase/oxoprolinase family protein [Planctomycetota bacterium]|nr:hydantoinase/oxoprolinase family protein [Planctomycetota bacterium]
MPPAHPIRLGVDTGGTFTDVVWTGPSGRGVKKLASTPDDPARAVLDGVAAVTGALPAGTPYTVHHGTTVGTNAVLTRGGARVVLVTTRGFEALLAVGRGQREGLHRMAPRRVAPLVEVANCVGAEERMGADARPVQSLTSAALDRLAAAVERRRPEAVAVCLLHAPRNAAHERRIVKRLRDVCPYVYASAASSPDPREVERATTTVLDAYVAPLVARYVASLADALPPDALTILRSDGGRMAVTEVRASPVRTLLSGPAAGVAAARVLAARHGLPRVLTFDVGGTSTDVAWVEGGAAPLGSELHVGPFAAGVPSVPIETVGAGGGSVVRVDSGGALRVGPESAGAAPGPACYGRGGPFALTDAWLLLGRIPDALLGGDFALDRAAARRAAARVAKAAGLSVPALCRGAVAVAATTTARALRLASAARGHDPRDAALLAFGGAGPVLACDTADQLGMRDVLVPTDPGTFAASGALAAPLRADASALAPAKGGETALDRVGKRLRREVETRLLAEGARGPLRFVEEVDARYAGQAFEVTVARDGWRERFHDRHEARYGFADARRPVECVRLRVRAEGDDHPGARPSDAHVAAPRHVRTRRLARDAKGVGTCARSTLSPGDRVRGPARIDEVSGTSFVPDGWSAVCLGDAALRIGRTR